MAETVVMAGKDIDVVVIIDVGKIGALKKDITFERLGGVSGTDAIGPK